MSRIELSDTPLTSMVKMAEGNPGAAVAMSELYKRAPDIDPDSVWGGLGPILALDTLGLYGPRIWLLWNDVCKADPVKVLTLLRAVQLGIIGDGVVLAAASERPSVATFDFDGLLSQVRAQLPKFANVVPAV